MGELIMEKESNPADMFPNEAITITLIIRIRI